MVWCEGCGVKLGLAITSACQRGASAGASIGAGQRRQRWMFARQHRAARSRAVVMSNQEVLRPRVQALGSPQCAGVRPSAATGSSARRERLRRGVHSEGLAAATAHQVPSALEFKNGGALPGIYVPCVKLSVGVRPLAATGRAERRERPLDNTNSNVCSNSQASGRLSFSRAFCITGRSCGLPSASA